MKDQVAVIKSSSLEVRAMMFDGTTVFCMKDILEACGIKYAAKWYARAKEREEGLSYVKLMYPMMTAAGPRQFKMWFVDAECGKKLLKLCYCTDDVKRWLENDVFTFSFDEAESPEAALNAVREVGNDAEDARNTGTKAGDVKNEVITIPRKEDLVKECTDICLQLMELCYKIKLFGKAGGFDRD